jgi:hypothetical protein
VKALLIEVREWVSFVLGAVGLLLTWHLRPVKQRRRESRRDVTIEAPAAQTDWSMPTPTRADLHFAQIASFFPTTDTDAWHPAVLDLMGEVSPYEFPPS